MNELLYIIWIPLIAGLVLFIVPESLRKITGLIASVISAIALTVSIILFFDTNHFIHGTISLLPSLSEQLINYNNLLGEVGTLVIDNIAKTGCNAYYVLHLPDCNLLPGIYKHKPQNKRILLLCSFNSLFLCSCCFIGSSSCFSYSVGEYLAFCFTN